MENLVKTLNEEGMYARPAGNFAKVAATFKSAVEIRANGQTKNGKSIMGIMSLGLARDTEFAIVTKGDDEAQALDALVALVNNKFAL